MTCSSFMPQFIVCVMVYLLFFLFFPGLDVIALSYHPQHRWQMCWTELKEEYLDVLTAAHIRPISGEARDDSKGDGTASPNTQKDKVATAYPCQSAAEHFVWKGAQQGADRN